MSNSDSEGENSDDLEKESSGSNQVVKMVFRKTIATTPISILIESLVKNLCAMIESDEKRALKIYNIICSKLFEMKLIDESYHMTEFEGMRGQYEKALYHLVKAARGGEELPKTIERMWLNDDLHAEWSHYQREFDEIAFIAGGGFGKVFRVLHKLDGNEYAIKKIYIRSYSIESIMNYLAEVKTFASLNHSNIVQYKGAWLELGVPTTKNVLQHTEDDSYEKQTHEKHQLIYPNLVSNLETSIHTSNRNSSNFEVEFENSTSRKYSHSNGGINRDSRKSMCSRNSISEGGKAICRYTEDNFNQPENEWATLYIQMALCQITLKQWLEIRNETQTNNSAIVSLKTKSRREIIMEILQQLLKGLQYIHSRGIVHHDIKPSNIFLQIDQDSYCVQLGDFGLACPLQNSKHSLALGTKLYAAPEQLEGKCNPKSDMYSLGIVLLELVDTFRTDMERVQCIAELRQGHLSAQITAEEPQLAHIISQLVSRCPHARPDASELLENLTNDTDDNRLVKQLKAQLVEKQDEISKLKDMLRKVGVEI